MAQAKHQTDDQWDGQKPQPATSSRDLALTRMEAAKARLAPASRQTIVVELSRCLTLCAPSGLTQDDREEWVSVAMPEVMEIPEDIFLEGCALARKKCDHPAKIIPAIVGYDPPFWGTSARRRHLHDCESYLENIDAKRIAQAEPDYVDPDDMAALVKELQTATTKVFTAPEKPIKAKRTYCRICLFASDNPMVASCQAENCGMKAV